MGGFSCNSVPLLLVGYCNTSSINAEGGKMLSTRLGSIPKQRERKTVLAYLNIEIGP